MMDKGKDANVSFMYKNINNRPNVGSTVSAVMTWEPRFFGTISVMFFIIQKDDNINACLESIQALKCPDNVLIRGIMSAREASIVYGFTKDRAAEIQIIVPSTTLLVNEHILYDIIEILEDDHDISLLGVRGITEMPLSGRWQDAEQIYGSVYEMLPDGKIKERIYGTERNRYELVHCIDDTILIQAGMPSWMSFNENEFLSAKISNFANNLGYKIATATPEHPWCMVIDEEHNADNGLVLAEYANYLQNDIFSLEEAKRFFTYGRDSHINEKGYFSHPSRIYIGDHVKIGIGAYFTLETEDAVVSVGNYAVLSDMVTIRSRSGVKVGHHARLGNNIVMDDTTDDGCIAAIKVGSYAILEDDVTILGGVTLGSACVVKAGSVVKDSLPAYCIAAGCPARIISLYDVRDNSWKKQLNDDYVEDILHSRREKPLLSIGIPTYNRSLYLRKALKFICDAVDEDDLVEIYISDNCSEDATQALVGHFEGTCPQLRYCRQEKNIGATNNLLSIWENTKGEYVWLLGDDDYISQNIVHDIISALMNNGDVSICALSILLGSDVCELRTGYGMDSYVDAVKTYITCITLLILKRDEYLRLEDKRKFIHTELNQVYIQLEMLRYNPKYCILYDCVVGYGTGDANRKYLPYKFRPLLFEVAIRQLFDIMLLYVQNGEIKPGTYKNFIRVHFWGHIHFCVELIKRSLSTYKIGENALEILKKYYGNEPYYEEAREYLEQALLDEAKN